LFFRYALKGNRRLKLLVNGSSVAKPLPFSDTGGWIVWKDQAAEAVLKKGANTIRLEAIGQSGPNIDALRIERFKAL
jgi:large repetitive protein